MSDEFKIIAKQLLVFSFLLGFLQLIVFMTGSFLATGKDFGTVITCQVYTHLTENLISLGVLFLVLVRISNRIGDVNFGKLLLAALLFAVISYHFWFLFKWIYFYSTHSGYVQQDLTGAGAQNIRYLIDKYGLNVVPPRYTPNYYFLNGLKNLLYSGVRFSILRVIFNPLVLSLWVSLIIWLLKRKNFSKPYNESTLENE